ncbi:hypothetical protein TIFTF001_046498 [Ficus carica]|uniref:Uncharacterized protein n=1 Tax=Ficus carica TaxID=3494 RepID=A0AA87ZRA4_FICCA|nr:hypothetical protein TIFTF001_046498 [Ficus carica]
MSQDHEEECSTQTQIRKPRRTNSPRFNPDEDGKRRATLMRRVHQVRTKEERIEVSIDAKGQPIGKEGDELQSWIGVLAREHIPIWISDFRSADFAPRKERVWVEIVTSFTMELSFKKQALKSCGELSEQESEIRKKSKYGSTGGRDRYRKRDQAHFEKTEKYAERHTRWLDMRVKPDGEFKNEAFKNITDTIDDFSQQETQKSFESVGTEDILTKALGNAEHSGRIRGQSKFVKQSQYFNLMQAEEATVPTVDQHNSFKASCTLNEKEAGPSDPKPMSNASKECQLFLSDLVYGGYVLVAIVLKLKRALLPVQTNEATCIEEAVSGFVAWLKRLVVVQTSLSQASQGPNHASDREAEGSKRTKKRAGRKKIQSQPEVQQQPTQQELPLFD